MEQTIDLELLKKQIKEADHPFSLYNKALTAVRPIYVDEEDNDRLFTTFQDDHNDILDKEYMDEMDLDGWRVVDSSDFMPGTVEWYWTLPYHDTFDEELDVDEYANYYWLAFRAFKARHSGLALDFEVSEQAGMGMVEIYTPDEKAIYDLKDEADAFYDILRSNNSKSAFIETFADWLDEQWLGARPLDDYYDDEDDEDEDDYYDEDEVYQELDEYLHEDYNEDDDSE